MAHPERLGILAALMDADLEVPELAARLGVKPASISRHLSVLLDLNLVSAPAPDTRPAYGLNLEALDHLRRRVMPHLDQPAYGIVDGHPQAAILNRFVTQGRLKELPANYSKRHVVLEWLAQQFDVGSTYGEPEVNAILAPHGPDVATLRRALVDHGLLQRQAGQYWVTRK
jgi:hypothetical protein